MMEMLPGTTRLLPPCQPAPSRSEEDQELIQWINSPTNTAWAPGATLREISARWAFMAGVLTKGSTSPAAAPRAGQTAPKR
jgi:hypothetical protein